ncbi:hypothetical protein FHW00_003949 [Ochrobactrum sp. P6BSIII]|nr:hypothetical protein [Ochrobactrum sp. P6BSIII]
MMSRPIRPGTSIFSLLEQVFRALDLGDSTQATLVKSCAVLDR